MIAALTPVAHFPAHRRSHRLRAGSAGSWPGNRHGAALRRALAASRPERDATSQTPFRTSLLLFVPAGVGIIVHLSRVADEWRALLVALVVSTFVSMAVTALVMKSSPARQPRRKRNESAHRRPLGLILRPRRCSA